MTIDEFLSKLKAAGQEIIDMRIDAVELAAKQKIIDEKANNTIGQLEDKVEGLNADVMLRDSKIERLNSEIEEMTLAYHHLQDMLAARNQEVADLSESCYEKLIINANLLNQLEKAQQKIADNKLLGKIKRLFWS